MTGSPGRYSFDTCSLIRIEQRPDGARAARAIWDALIGPALVWRIQLVETVFDELAAKPDIVERYLKPFRREQVCVPRSEFSYGLMERNLVEVRNAFPRMSKRRQGRERSDSFIVAHARTIAGTTIVTEESPRHRGNIPAACRYYGIECINLEEFLRRESLI